MELPPMSQLSPVLQRAPLGGDLIDLVTESVAQPPCPAERAQVILDLLDVALDAVSWRLTGDGGGEEEQKHSCDHRCSPTAPDPDEIPVGPQLTDHPGHRRRHAAMPETMAVCWGGARRFLLRGRYLDGSVAGLADRSHRPMLWRASGGRRGRGGGGGDPAPASSVGREADPVGALCRLPPTWPVGAVRRWDFRRLDGEDQGRGIS